MYVSIIIRSVIFSLSVVLIDGFKTMYVTILSVLKPFPIQ